VRPRPAILLTLVYGAGLATGLLRFGSPLGAAALLAAGPISGRGLLALMAVGGMLGRVSAEVAWLLERPRCTTRLPPGRMHLDLELLEPAPGEGGRVMVRPLAAGCTGPVSASWPSGMPLGAGFEVAVEGRWIPRRGPAGRAAGVLAVVSMSKPHGAPRAGARLRTALAEASRSLYGARAGLVDALILGRRGGIDPDLQQRFADAGLVHLLSISGFHVGLITAWVFLVGRLLCLGRSQALATAGAASVAYVAFLGWPAPATRAAALAVVTALCRTRQRHVHADSVLAATCLMVLLLDPWAILDLGGWLSAAALWGATRFSRWTDRVFGTAFGWRTLGSSVGATVATAPITAAALGTVALAGLGLNFVAIPLAALAVPGVLASLLLYPVAVAPARAFAAGAGLSLHLIELVATAGAAFPGGHFATEPGQWLAALPWLVVLAVALWIVDLHNTPAEAGRRVGWVAALGLWFVLLRGTLSASGASGRDLALHFLDVGQGDAAVLRTPLGHWVLVDAGPAGDRSDAGRRVVAPFLARHGARGVTLVVVSHAHADHLGGIPAVLARFPTGLVLEPGALVPDPRYMAFLGTLEGRHIPWHPVRGGERFTLDSVSFTVLHPVPGWSGWGEDVNEDSVVLLVEYRGFQALFAGDAGFPAEAAMSGALRPVDVLKVGHHGSRGSTGDAWLDALRPKAAVISVGRNDYGHPSPAALARLATAAVEVRRTDLEGTITITTDGSAMRVESRERASGFDVR
jgi:competence protein ComEC